MKKNRSWKVTKILKSIRILKNTMYLESNIFALKVVCDSSG